MHRTMYFIQIETENRSTKTVNINSAEGNPLRGIFHFCFWVTKQIIQKQQQCQVDALSLFGICVGSSFFFIIEIIFGTTISLKFPFSYITKEYHFFCKTINIYRIGASCRRSPTFFSRHFEFCHKKITSHCMMKIKSKSQNRRFVCLSIIPQIIPKVHLLFDQI